MCEPADLQLPAHVRNFADALSCVPAVASVRLGGSRGGRDWDLLAYLRPSFTWQSLARALPPGTETARFSPTLPTALGEASLSHPEGTVDCAFVDLRRLEWSARNSRRGRFSLLPMARSLEGMPSYVLEAEEALAAPLSGPSLAPSSPPAPLVTEGRAWWAGRAALSLLIAEDSLRVGDPLTAGAHCASALWSVSHHRALGAGWYLPGKRLLVTTVDAETRAIAAAVVAEGPAAEQLVGALRDRLELTAEQGLAWARAAAESGPEDKDD